MLITPGLLEPYSPERALTFKAWSHREWSGPIGQRCLIVQDHGVCFGGQQKKITSLQVGLPTGCGSCLALTSLDLV